MRLLIVHHEHTDLSNPDRYLSYNLTPLWQELGIDVLHVAGVKRLPPADAVLLHIDLSVIPERFLLALEAYPVVLNRQVTDIRKRSLPMRSHLLGPDAFYDGPVVVKTNLNNAGAPERELYRRGGFRLPLKELWSFYRATHLPGVMDYQIYASTEQVPAPLRKNTDYVMEKFLPERENQQYVLRLAYFLGSRCHGVKLVSNDQIVRGQNLCAPPVPMEKIHPEVLAFREHISLDYGKVDYVLHDGKVVILDVNKTLGSPSFAIMGKEAALDLVNGLPLPK